MTETFVDIPGYEGFYQISNMGTVRSMRRIIICKNGQIRLCPQRVLKQNKDSKGYLNVNLSKNSHPVPSRVHKLMKNVFMDPNSRLQVNHIDGNKTNNRIENLELVTNSQNQTHAVRLGIRGTKLSVSDVEYIKTHIDHPSKGLALKFNVDVSLIRLIKREKQWKHVTV